MDQLYPVFPVLIIDDEQNFLNSVEFELLSNGLTNVECCLDSRDVLPRLKEKEYSVILLDLFMPNISGEELLLEIVRDYPGTPVVIVTAFPEYKKAVECLKKGAFDCLTKPVKMKDLIRTIRDAINLKGSHKDIILMKNALFSDVNTGEKKPINIITTGETMQFVFQIIGLFAVTSRPLLLRGEYGACKEFTAHETHNLSKRSGYFIPFDTTGIDDNSFNDKLFGKEKNIHPGEGIDKHCLLEKARGGTLYINEIGDISLASQEKLLHLLQEYEYYPPGFAKPVDADARIIAGTNKNLDALVQVKSFNQGLYSLLKAYEISLPPLRERREDIRLLFEYFVQQAAASIGIKTPHIPGGIFDFIENYDFPGNISELKEIVYEAVSRHESGTLSLNVIKEKMKSSAFPTSYGIKIPANKRVFFGKDLPTFAEMEAIYMDEILKRAKGDQRAAAKLAGLSISAFALRLKRIKKIKKRKKGSKDDI